MVPVPVTVRLVEVLASTAFPEPAIVHVPEPMPTVLVLEVNERNDEVAPDSVTLYVTALNVPALIISAVAELKFV